MVEVMVSELLMMTSDLTDEEFSRGKNKFKSDMFMDLESRIVQIDDLIRQVLLNGTRISAETHGKKIDLLTKEDLMRVAKQMLSTTPTIVSHGPKDSVEVVPSSRKVHMYLKSKLDEK
jgi:predicted Zn-dependent peptidase